MLLNTLVKPVNHSSWSEAQGIHGISPKMVPDAPTYDQLRSQIKELVSGHNVVIYNADYDSMFLCDELKEAASVECCMLDFAEEYGEWNDYHEDYKWQKLTTAARYVLHKWEGKAHRALADTLATRSVWKYLTDPDEKMRVAEHWEQKRLIRETREKEEKARIWLSIMERRKLYEEERASKSWSDFLQVWWLRQPLFKHWARDIDDRADALCLLFYGRPLWVMELEESSDTVYRKKKDIPAQLVPKSYFKKHINHLCLTWFEEKLEPSGAVFVGKKTAWELYDISEYERIKKRYSLRLAHPRIKGDEQLVSRTKAKKMGIELSGLEPVCETQTGYGDWYYQYKVKA